VVEGSSRKLLPVRSNHPIPKGRLIEAIYNLSEAKVKPPIKIGQIIIPNIIGKGADLVASDELTGKE
jgi:CxxC motif-containing protein